jgi:anaerobic selenocysteine-containing dehydrogenase
VVAPLYGGINYGRLVVTRYLKDTLAMPGAVSYKQLRVDGLQWPCPTPDHPGTAVLYTEGRAPGAGLAPAPDLGQAPAPTPGPVRLIAGFSLFPYRTGTWSRHSRSLAHLQPHSRLHLHPDDARGLGLRHVEQVRITAAGAPREDAAAEQGLAAALNARPTEAITRVSVQVPVGSAFLAMTLAQAGRSPLVRQALTAQAHPEEEGAGLPIAVGPLAGPPPATPRWGQDRRPSTYRTRRMPSSLPNKDPAWPSGSGSRTRRRSRRARNCA